MTSDLDRPVPGRVATWLTRWGPVLPLLGAELVLLLGFGAILPILSIYFTEHGVDIPTLGIVVAAWPATRLIAEPAFGWLADRTARPPLMVAGLVLSGIFAVAPLVVEGALAFILLRGLAGAAAALYDPAARGYLMDATPANRRGEAFGLYSAAQMAGFIFGPALGGLAAALTGDVRSVFALGGLVMLGSAVVVALKVRELPDRSHVHAAHPVPATEIHREASPAPAPVAGADAPRSLVNRLLLAAIALNFGNYFAGGMWEVIWSLFMIGRGASVEFVGLTFALFGVPILFLSPLVGRLVDRRGPVVFIVVGSLAAVVTSLVYTVVHDLTLLAIVVLVEGAGWALVTPALYAVVARGTPAGRSSTAQGMFGASGTLANIGASALAGTMFATNRDLPFYSIAIVVLLSLAVSLLIAGRAAMRPARAVPNPVPTEVT
ncbi:MAG: MFS transporter [Chloroflexi bacterium]|nr:MFS transporter [Chloroflexota bacterium]